MKKLESRKRLFGIIKGRLAYGRVAIIIRGPQGTGKTYLSKLIEKEFKATGRRVKRIEAAMYFTKDGKYEWDRAKLPEAHKWCKESFSKFLTTNDITIVANVFKCKSQVKDYIKLASTGDSSVIIVRLTNIHENEHNVPEECVLDTAAHMEPMPSEFVAEEDL